MNVTENRHNSGGDPVNAEDAPCPICGGSSSRTFQHVQDRELRICEQCRHISWRDLPSPEELRSYYETTYTASHHQLEIQLGNKDYYRSHLRELLKITGIAAEDATLVDYGCSFPVLLQQAKEMGFRGAMGVDHDHTAIAYGREHGIEIHEPSRFSKDVADSSVDIIRFSHTIEHLIDPIGTLTIATAKLRTGGLLHLTQPSFPVFSLEECPERLKDCVWPDHLHYFSPLSLRIAAQRVGIQVAQLFTHQNALAAVTHFAPHIDFAYAAKELIDLADQGAPSFGRLSNYPVFAGENSVLNGIK